MPLVSDSRRGQQPMIIDTEASEQTEKYSQRIVRQPEVVASSTSQGRITPRDSSILAEQIVAADSEVLESVGYGVESLNLAQEEMADSAARDDSAAAYKRVTEQIGTVHAMYLAEHYQLLGTDSLRVAGPDSTDEECEQAADELWQLFRADDAFQEGFYGPDPWNVEATTVQFAKREREGEFSVRAKIYLKRKGGKSAEFTQMISRDVETTDECDDILVDVPGGQAWRDHNQDSNA